MKLASNQRIEQLTEKSFNLITDIKMPNGSIRRSVETHNLDSSLTEQQFKDDADANFVISRSLKNGIDPFQNQGGYYADVSEIPDLSTALQTVTKANEAFDSLPSDVRARFGNSPVQLLKFLEDPENTAEGIKLGLFQPTAPEPAPIAVKIMAEKTPEASPDKK